MIIKVTQEHIDNGIQCHHGSCPVSLALEAATGTYWSVAWGKAREIPDLYDQTKERSAYPIPDEPRIFISLFDRFGPKAVVPFSFKLPIGESQ